MHCPGAIGNPFLDLRRGQGLYEQEELDAATDEFIRAIRVKAPTSSMAKIRSTLDSSQPVPSCEGFAADW
jgi:hypothetical protein